MPHGFLIIGITPPTIRGDEAQIITAHLTDGNVDYFHLRHPSATADEMQRLISAIPAQLRERLSLHDHHHLGALYGIGGLHLNSRNPRLPALPEGYRPRVSRSCHSVAEVMDAAHAGAPTQESESATYPLTYVTLSPIFDSISKQGYGAAFPPEQYNRLRSDLAAAEIPVVALGGVTPTRTDLLRNLGFAGAAMLGALWPESPCHQM